MGRIWYSESANGNSTKYIAKQRERERERELYLTRYIFRTVEWDFENENENKEIVDFSKEPDNQTWKDKPLISKVIEGESLQNIGAFIVKKIALKYQQCRTMENLVEETVNKITL